MIGSSRRRFLLAMSAFFASGRSSAGTPSIAAGSGGKPPGSETAGKAIASPDIALPASGNDRGIVHIDDYGGADFSAKLIAAIAALPARGGTVIADRLASQEKISRQIIIDKPIELQLGATTLVVTSDTTSPAIRVVRTCKIRGTPGAGFRDTSGTVRGTPGTMIQSSPGYRGDLISVENVAPYDQFNAAKTQIEDISFESRGQSTRGVTIRGTFGVRLARLIFTKMASGVDLINLENSQGFSEASEFEDLYFEDCLIGILATGNSHTDSIGHAQWTSLRINMNSPNAIGIQLNRAALYASTITGITMWPSQLATGSIGVQLNNIDIDERTVFNKVYFESECPTFTGWKLTGKSATLPTIIATDISGQGQLYDVPPMTTYWALGRHFSINGDFEKGVQGWVYVNSPIATSAPAGQSGRCLKLQTQGQRAGIASRGITTKLGHRYRIVVWFKRGSAPNGLIRLGHAVGDDGYASIAPSDQEWARHEFTIVATGRALVLSLYSSSSDAAGHHSLYDSISIEEMGYSLDSG
jgi:hypothetical protein